MIDVERLKHDRDYWDSVAVEGATHFCPNGWSVNWYRQDGAGLYCWRPSCKEWAKSHHHTVGKFIPRPTRKQWSGPEDGFPPVGAECMTIGGEGKVIGVDERRGKVAIQWHDGNLGVVLLNCVKPPRTEKERVVEATVRKMGWEIDGTRAALESAYDAGALKMPEEDQ